jgi:methylmalonyl-CoA mutase cobalamin-binding subunit
MARGRGFELIPQPIPPRRVASSNFYRQIVDEFLKANVKSALVSGTDRKPATLVQGLRKVLQRDGITEVAVLQRSNDVYLSRR